MIEFRSIRPITNVRELVFNFKVFSGDLKIYLKKGTKPQSDNEFDNFISINNNEKQLQANTTNFKLKNTGEKDTITGVYYIWFEAESTVLVEVKAEYIFQVEVGQDLPSQFLKIDNFN